jgi:DNA/RNA-binding domain of Phe-tRNA-synthetase-like protein
MKKMIIEDAIFEMFPETQIGIIISKNIKNDEVNESITSLLREAEKQVQDNYTGTAILDLPEMKTWRETYKKFGAKKGRRVSIETIVKRVLKGDKLPAINSLVDVYNAISLKYMFPCGGEDLDQMEGDLRLALADGTEPFMTIGSDENDPPKEGEVVYKDDTGCVCRCWNWREADRTKLTEDTKNAILVVESLESNREGELKEALESLSKLVNVLLGGTTKIQVLNKENREMEI